MIIFVFIFMGVVTALALVAILAKANRGEPKKAEKWEKAEIIKQLVTLSERENNTSAIASPPTRRLPLAPNSATRSDTLRKYKYRGPDSKLRCSPMNPNSFVPHRPNLADAEIEDQIRQRAYELCQERGGVDGNATDDWLRAKEEVLSSKGKGATTSS
jgi:DUF2934 family protein